jgi:two-component system chemotaxis response regulator CheB
MLLIGASTGGPQALTRLIGALPATFPVPIALVLHMPAGYTETFARRLDGDCELDVTEARDGMPLRPGLVVVARAGMHLSLAPKADGWACKLDVLPLDTLHRPAVDVLFSSAAAHVGAGALAVVLTGMGSDGLRGATLLHAAGGRVLTEAESSCVVYGMPRTVFEAGLASAEAPIETMAALICEYL